jgi:hypothetical protein
MMNNNTPEPFRGTPWRKPDAAPSQPKRAARLHRLRRPILWLIAPPLMLAVGMAAFAAWTSSGIVQQQVSSGSGPTISLVSTSGTTVGNTLTLNALNNVSPSFTTGDETVSISNTGSASASIASMAISATPSNALGSQVNLCVADGYPYLVLYNGPLASAGALTPSITIGAGNTDHETINLSAGSESTICGNTAAGGTTTGDTTNSAAPLSPSAEALTVELSIAYTFSS